MRYVAAKLSMAGLALMMGTSAHAQEVRTPQGEYFQMGKVGGTVDDNHFYAHFLPPHEEQDGGATTSGGLFSMTAGETQIGSWTVDNATGAVTIDFGLTEPTYCDSWPDYMDGETIDLTAPSERNCWVGDNHASYVSEMIYEGLR